MVYEDYINDNNILGCGLHISLLHTILIILKNDSGFKNSSKEIDQLQIKYEKITKEIEDILNQRLTPLLNETTVIDYISYQNYSFFTKVD